MRAFPTLAVLLLLTGCGSVATSGHRSPDETVSPSPTSPSPSSPGSGAPTATVTVTETPAAGSTAAGAGSPVVVDAPADGATVPATFGVRGRASTVEGTVVWELRQGAGGPVVKHGFTTARECCTLSPYAFEVQGVPAGRYQLVVHDTNDGGDAEGTPVTRVVHALTVGR